MPQLGELKQRPPLNDTHLSAMASGLSLDREMYFIKGVDKGQIATVKDFTVAI